MDTGEYSVKKLDITHTSRQYQKSLHFIKSVLVNILYLSRMEYINNVSMLTPVTCMRRKKPGRKGDASDPVEH